MGDTRIQAAVVSCKVFVRHLDVLLDPASFPSTITAANTAGLTSPPATPAREPHIDTVLASAAEKSPQDQPPMSKEREKAEKETKWDGIRLWSRLLQMLERLLKSSATSGAAHSGGHAANEGLDEAIPESLKNIILVMASGGYLVPPSGGAGAGRTPLQKRLWEVTYARMERFLPGLLEAVFPGVGEAGETPMREVGREEVERGMLQGQAQPQTQTQMPEQGQGQGQGQVQNTADGAADDSGVSVKLPVREKDAAGDGDAGENARPMSGEESVAVEV